MKQQKNLVMFVIAAVVHPLTKLALKGLLKTKVYGREHWKQLREPSLLVANHSSFLDYLLVQLLLPKKPCVVLNKNQIYPWYVRISTWQANHCWVNFEDSKTTTAVIQEQLKAGKHCLIFPEGMPSQFGGLQKIHANLAIVIESVHGPILPLRIAVSNSYFFAKVQIYLQPPTKLNTNSQKPAAVQIYDMLSTAMFKTTNLHQNLWQAILASQPLHGTRRNSFVDHNQTPLSFKKLLLVVFILGEKLFALTRTEPRVGVLLPTSVGCLVAVLSLLAYRKTSVMLNFSSSIQAVQIAAQLAQINSILTSRKFIEQANLQPLAEALEKDYAIIYLEDARESLTIKNKLMGLWKVNTQRKKLPGFKAKLNEPAFILFTSGSAGIPKGVVLSMHNILAQCAQYKARFDFFPKDGMFNCLPMFHSFGLVPGVFLPLLHGMRIFLYPSPLHYKQISSFCHQSQATLMISTNTFLNQYGRYATAKEFTNLRMILAGAEKIQPETKDLWNEKFGVQVFEGYGTTETSPVISVNSPLFHKPQTAGRMLPGIEYKLVQVEGIQAGGVLHVRGANIMLGYLNSEDTHQISAPKDGWHDTGDIVEVDDLDYIKIVGRQKRFCKIGGELIALAAVEEWITSIWPDARHAVVAIENKNKGEILALATEQADASIQALAQHAKQQGQALLFVPKHIFVVDEIPLLGLGKVDYPNTLKLIATQQT